MLKWFSATMRFHFLTEMSSCYYQNDAVLILNTLFFSLEQTNLKLIAGKGQHKDKVYSFFTEKHKSKDGESEQWIPRVSQSCMVSRITPENMTPISHCVLLQHTQFKTQSFKLV